MSESGVSGHVVSIVVAVGDGDAETLDRAARVLRNELRRLDVERVSSVTGAAPEGVRAVDAAVVGALVVQVLPALQQIESIVATVRRWVAGRPQRTASITIDGDVLTISGASEKNVDDLVRHYIEQHAKATG